MNKDERMTAAQVIGYMKTFPPDARLGVIAIDTHQEQKVCFPERDVIFITDSDAPAMIVNIDCSEIEDITEEVIESEESEEEEEENEKSE